MSVDGSWLEEKDELTVGVVVAFGPRTTRAGEVVFIARKLSKPEEGASNFDSELAARMIGLAETAEAGAERVLCVFDATSPVMKSMKFRRQDVRARSRCACDEWLGTLLVLEDEHEEIHYDWCRSHTETKMPHSAVGSYLYNVVADKLCDGARKGVAVPWRRPRHKTMRFAARGSERQWLRRTYGEVIDARLRRGSEDSVGGRTRWTSSTASCAKASQAA